VAKVILRAPLKDRVGGSEVSIDGSTVSEVISKLEQDNPAILGWVLDEQGSIRPHVNVFLNGEKTDENASVSERDDIQIIHAISGGADEVEVLLGTRKGLVVLRGTRGERLDVVGREFEGIDVEYAMRDPRSGTYIASVTHGQYGPHLYWATDPLGEWTQAEGPVFPKETGAKLVRVWVIVPGEEPGVLWAGVDPAALFRSEDDGKTWAFNPWLWDHPSRPKWQPGGGGLALHSIVPWPGDPARLMVGISAAGIWHTEDGGYTWERGNEGIVPRYLPEDATPDETVALCIHNIKRSADPNRLYMQFHGGVYRSDDGGHKWQDIGSETGLPSDFGFPMVAHPRDPNRAYVVPLKADLDRVTPEGKVVVYETDNGGSSWSPRFEGLPQIHAYMVILRQAFAHDGKDPLGLYFGTTTGQLFASADDGLTWTQAVENLPPILSVRCSS
jgi:molybdopterin converting factor small subunit/photosystem II stability/assembly factor-like uncharacterized protein